jgi:hypothetical protein
MAYTYNWPMVLTLADKKGKRRELLIFINYFCGKKKFNFLES